VYDLILDKNHKDPLYKEVKKILINQVELDSDGHLIAVTDAILPVWGPADGEHKIHSLGITTREFYYKSKYSDSKALYTAGEAMSNIGRRVNLRCMDNAVACLVKSYFFYPAVLVFFVNEENRFQLSIYTARTFLSFGAVNVALNRFDKFLPETMERRMSSHSIKDVWKTIVYNIKKTFVKDKFSADDEHISLSKMKSEKKKNKEKKKISKKEAAWKKAEKKAMAKREAAEKAAAKREAAWKKAEEKAAAMREEAEQDAMLEEEKNQVFMSEASKMEYDDWDTGRENDHE